MKNLILTALLVSGVMLTSYVISTPGDQPVLALVSGALLGAYVLLSND